MIESSQDIRAILVRYGVLSAIILLEPACSKDTQPQAEQPKPTRVVEPGVPSKPAEATGSAAPTENPAAAPEQARPQAASRYTEANFDLSIAATKSPKAGEPSDAQIVLQAKAPFHVNESYPYKFKLKQAKGLKLEKAVLSAEAVKLEKQRAVMTVGFTPETPGKKTLSGQFSFSICTEDKCLIEKRDLSLDLDVK